jgi:hypothetical protein
MGAPVAHLGLLEAHQPFGDIVRADRQRLLGARWRPADRRSAPAPVRGWRWPHESPAAPWPRRQRHRRRRAHGWC